MALNNTSVIVTLALLAGYYLYRRFTSSRSHLPLPPGPKGLLGLGNVNDLPKPGVMEAHHWAKHKELYGPISSVTVLGQTLVILNDAKIASGLLRDRSAIHSSRPIQTFASEMVGWKNITAMSPYNDAWKEQRKNITKIVSTNKSVAVFDRYQEVEAAHFLLNVLKSPQDLFEHIRHEAGTVILKVVYGYQTRAEGKDPLVKLAGDTMVNFAEACVPGKFLVDVLPFLRFLPDWFPGTGFKQTAKQYAAEVQQCLDQPYNFTKQQMEHKRHKTSYLSQAIETSGNDPFMDHVNKWSSLALCLGGADTTVSAFMSFFLAMMVYPEVQTKAQEEIDRVIGPDRLPLISDMPNLPYIEAIMKETHRWNPVAPMGLPHCSVQEDVYNGYRIPKGALLLYNTWEYTHNPTTYPDPTHFRPERHLITPNHPAEPDPRKYIYGFGRRICPGRFVADNSLFITIAQSLAVFKFEKPRDAAGKVIEPRIEYEAGAISHPVPYEISIRPRSERHERLIEKVREMFPWEESDVKELEGVRW